MHIKECYRVYLCFYIQIAGTAYNFVCKPGWYDRHYDYCYMKFLNLPTTWINAQSKCRENGGFLVGIRDQQKQNYIQGTRYIVWLLLNSDIEL